ncbi:hypothetical protein HY641_03990 [Candidatus Woesearchaeota archaeon]|nr:hypothetical protein [Candidatus Woesearchaeota archaeon]
MARGMLFTLTIFFVTVFILIQGYIILLDKHAEIQGSKREIGSEQGALLATQAVVDVSMLYLDEAVTLSVWDAVYDLGRIGFPTRCGRDNGIPLLSTPTQSVASCAASASEKLSELTRTKLNKLLSLHPSHMLIDYVSVVPFLEGIDVYGTSSALLEIPFSENRGRLSEKPRFHIFVPYRLNDYTQITSTLTGLVDACSGIDPEPCIRQQLRDLRTPEITWTMGSCGESAPATERTYAFCIRSATTHGHYRDGEVALEPVMYSVAAHFPARVPLAVTALRANGLPQSGSVFDAATLALRKGDAIAYEGTLRSPSTTGLQAQMCLGDTCEHVDTLTPLDATTYRFSGRMESLQGPYAVVMKASVGSEHIEAGMINVLKIV